MHTGGKGYWGCAELSQTLHTGYLIKDHCLLFGQKVKFSVSCCTGRGKHLSSLDYRRGAVARAMIRPAGVILCVRTPSPSLGLPSPASGWGELKGAPRRVSRGKAVSSQELEGSEGWRGEAFHPRERGVQKHR